MLVICSDISVSASWKQIFELLQMFVREEDINDYEIQYTGHSPHLLLLEN
jgi:hypothetical protein